MTARKRSTATRHPPPATRRPQPQPGHRPGLELCALLGLLGLSAALFHFTGPAGFSIVVSTGVGLFATWRTRR